MSDLHKLAMGTAKVDITPHWKVPLAGFSHREGKFESVRRPLYARIFVFESGCGNDRAARSLFVSADLIWWGSERVAPLLSRISDRWGIDATLSILHATHTHSGPQTTTRFASSMGVMDEAYICEMEERIISGIGDALMHLEPVAVERGAGVCSFGIHRRKKDGNRVVMAPNREGPVDPNVDVVRFTTSQGNCKAIWFQYACHPTTTGDNEVSSEFPGAAADILEQRLGGGVLAAYLQGCCGDIRPNLVKDGQFYRGGDAEVGQLGRLLADAVTEVLERLMRPLTPTPLQSRFQTVGLALQHAPDSTQSQIPFEMRLMTLAEGLSLLAMNGEVVVDYGLFVRRMFESAVIPMPYSNGMVGYIPTTAQVEEGGYEGRDSFVFFGYESPPAAGLESQIHAAILSLVQDTGTNH